jgi:hypothetical protein
MEKFSQWRDGATGIAPFLPNSRPLLFDSPAANIASTVVKTVLALASFPCVLYNLGVYLLIVQWIPIPVVRQYFIKYCVLLSLRMWQWDLAFEGVSKRK